MVCPVMIDMMILGFELVKTRSNHVARDEEELYIVACDSD